MQPQGQRGQAGFTLVELLVVLLVLAILAALGLPLFVGQTDKGHDADAKSNARSLAVHVQSCATDDDGDYSACDQDAMRAADTGLPVGAGAGSVEVVDVDADGFELRARSRSGRVYTVTRDHGGMTLSCTVAGGTCAW